MGAFTGAGGAAYSSDSNEWETPRWLFDRLDQAFHFTLDPCSTDANAKCLGHFTIRDNGLALPWRGNVFVNPPYGREIGDWVGKCHHEHEAGGANVMLLVPSRTDTAWFHDHIYGIASIRFLRGRLKFEVDGVPQGSAPFPSMLVGYGLDPWEVDLNA